MTKIIIGLVLIAIILASCGETSGTATPGQNQLPTVPANIVTAAGKTITMQLEVATTSQQQEVGLMGRTNVPNDSGMLFAFAQLGNINFWMKDTKIALSIAFIDQNGQILDIQDMQPFSLAYHTSIQPYQYALEVGLGWFAQQNVKAGDRINFKLGG